MGREIKRVALDFDWPLNQTWQGYLMPESLRLPDCPDCDGSGWSETARQMNETWYSNSLPYRSDARKTSRWCDKLVQADVDALWDAGRLHHDFRDGKPTAEQVNDWSRRDRGLGHDAINRMIVVERRCEAIGAQSRCARCGGHGDVGTAEQREAVENWERIEPPAGDGWQLWETVSEGSPISPVFAERGGLIDWLCSPFYNWGVSTPLSREQAEAFVGSGWAPSFIASAATGVIPGEQFVGGAR